VLYKYNAQRGESGQPGMGSTAEDDPLTSADLVQKLSSMMRQAA
jgi:hypothetical protein